MGAAAVSLCAAGAAARRLSVAGDALGAATTIARGAARLPWQRQLTVQCPARSRPPPRSVSPAPPAGPASARAHCGCCMRARSIRDRSLRCARRRARRDRHAFAPAVDDCQDAELRHDIRPMACRRACPSALALALALAAACPPAAADVADVAVDVAAAAVLERPRWRPVPGQRRADARARVRVPRRSADRSAMHRPTCRPRCRRGARLPVASRHRDLRARSSCMRAACAVNASALRASARVDGVERRTGDLRDLRRRHLLDVGEHEHPRLSSSSASSARALPTSAVRCTCAPGQLFAVAEVMSSATNRCIDRRAFAISPCDSHQ